jgi:hypothetical protein
MTVRADGPFGEWRFATLGTPVPLFDSTGTSVRAYLLPVDYKGACDGYMTVSADSGPGSHVLEFSHNPPPVALANPKATLAALAAGPDASPVRWVYLGPLSYGLETGQGSTGQVATLQDPIDSGPQVSSPAPSQPEITAGSLGSDYHEVSGVPDYNQYEYLYYSSEYNQYSVPAAYAPYSSLPFLGAKYCSGCVATAAGNIVQHWASLFPDLAPSAKPHYGGARWQKLVNDLHVYMHTFRAAGGLAGAAYGVLSGPGMVAYARDHGDYPFTTSFISYVGYSQFVSEIAANRPVELEFEGLGVSGPTTREYYGDHAVTGVGYDYTPGDVSSEYMIVRDNWPSTPHDVYVQFQGAQSAYAECDMSTFVPPPTPANDAFPGTTISGDSGSGVGTNVGSTTQPGEPHPTAQPVIASTIWYTWTAPSSGLVTFKAVNSNFDTVLGIYAGDSLGSLHEVASDDKGGGWYTPTSSEVDFVATGGVTYHVQASGYAGLYGSFGTVHLSWQTSPSSATTLQMIAASASGFPYGTRVDLTGMLSASGMPLAQQPVTLQSSSDGTTFTDSVSVSSGPTGQFTINVNPTSLVYYRLVFNGSTYCFASGPTQVASFTPQAGLTTPSSASTMLHSRHYLVSGFLKPRAPGGTAPVHVHEYRYVKRRWVASGVVAAKTSDYSWYTRYTVSLRLPRVGRWRLRAYFPGDSQNAATWSGYRYVVVR